MALTEAGTFKSLVDFLKSRRGMRLLSIPTKLNFKIATFLDSADAQFYYDNISDPSKINGIKYMEEDHIVLHYVKPDMKYFANKYDINTVVAQKKALRNAETRGINYEFREEDKLFENDEYVVYRMP